MLQVVSASPFDANVLITGENGTGKEAAAGLRSIRAAPQSAGDGQRRWLSKACESELFGHIKGAFTDAKADRVGRFELADSGTLFLDEIANIPLPQQASCSESSRPVSSSVGSKTRRVNVRIISATNADLQAEVAAGKFHRSSFV